MGGAGAARTSTSICSFPGGSAVRSGAKERGGRGVPPGTLFDSSGIVGERVGYVCVFSNKICFVVCNLFFSRFHHGQGSLLGVSLVDGYHARFLVEKQSRMRFFCPRPDITRFHAKKLHTRSHHFFISCGMRSGVHVVLFELLLV